MLSRRYGDCSPCPIDLQRDTAANPLYERYGQGSERPMKRLVRGFAVFGCVLSGILVTDAAMAQKSGGILKVYHRDSPASMSILEEGTNSTEIPMMGVFNNLVMRPARGAKQPVDDRAGSRHRLV